MLGQNITCGIVAVELFSRCHSFCMLHFIPRQKLRQRLPTAATAATYM